MTLSSIRDSILCFLSPTYRNHVQIAREREEALALAREAESFARKYKSELEGARAEIQTLSTSYRNSSDLATSLRAQLDEARADHRWLTEQAIRSAQCTTDWLARQTIAHSPVFGTGPEPPTPPPVPEDAPVSAGKVHARRVASAQTAKFMEDLEARYRASTVENPDAIPPV